MIKDIEEESKTKFSMGVEFSFSFKAEIKNGLEILTRGNGYVILHPA